MNLLLDENLSRKLIQRFADLFPKSIHVSDVGLLHVADSTIWKFAAENGFCVVSADSDFYERALAFGPPPKVIWLKGCDYPTAGVEELMRSQAIRIVEFLQTPERAVLVLPRLAARARS